MSDALAQPTSQAAPGTIPPNVHTLNRTAQLEALYTIIRDKTTSRGDFIFYSVRPPSTLLDYALTTYIGQNYKVLRFVAFTRLDLTESSGYSSRKV